MGTNDPSNVQPFAAPRSGARRARLILALLVALPLAAAPAGAQESVTIQSVDNYAGNSNVYTDRPNTTITVTELDHNFQPVRSWTGTTDSDGKLTIRSTNVLSKPYLRAKVASSDKAPLSLVAPSELHAGEPFTFAAVGALEGEVLRVETLEGVVVAEEPADRHGRVWLAAGLAAAGPYLVKTGDGNRPAGQIEVKPPVADALLRPGEPPRQPLKVIDPPRSLERGSSPTLDGTGFDPDARRMVTRVGGGEVPVLAATADELHLGPVDCDRLGPAEIEVINLATGETVSLEPLLLYDLEVSLRDARLANGEPTFVDFRLAPVEAVATVSTTIAGGPVSFAGGAKQATTVIENGGSALPLAADPLGDGRFSLNWRLDSIELPGAAQDAETDRRNAELAARDAAGWRQSARNDPDARRKQEKENAAGNADQAASNWERAAAAREAGDGETAGLLEEAARKREEAARQWGANGDGEAAKKAEQAAAELEKKAKK